jgi:hypothetical protein
MPERYCYLNAEGASGCGRQPGGSAVETTQAVFHLIEMHAKLRRVQDGQLKADE